MNDNIRALHHSHQQYYRSPFGAAAVLRTVRIRLRVEASTLPKRVVLRLWKEKDGEQNIEMMARTEARGAVYEASVKMPSVPQLVWYYFVIETGKGVCYYGNKADGLGGEGHLSDKEPPAYQITVTKEGASTPAWWKDAVLYQIFPDRFCRSEGASLPVKTNGVYHLDWNDPPFYTKDSETGEVVEYDFFGGDLGGIRSKLSYLKELGISVLYLNPVFYSPSNHRYDTSDYRMIDPILGTNEDMEKLCAEAKEMGISILLDGVFSHTGADSKYFNKYGNFDSIGAYQSKKSPYAKWYRFNKYPKDYECWWGFGELPNVDEMCEDYRAYIISDRDSVLHSWHKAGIKGWRLDVADELPEEFIKEFYRELKAADPDNILLGEVWEDASNKVSYGMRREYFLGDDLDSVMNYPFRNIVLDFFGGKATAHEAGARLLSLAENYPAHYFYATMNLVGSHDVERALTVLGEAPAEATMTAFKRSRYQLSEKAYAKAKARLKLASLMQMTMPGVPSIYYGDEAGVEGYRDPYNRKTYPWGREDKGLLAHYQTVIGLRNDHDALRTGDWDLFSANDDVLAYGRRIVGGKDRFGTEREDGTFIVMLNRSDEEQTVTVDVRAYSHGRLTDLLSDMTVTVEHGCITVTLAPYQGVVFREEEESRFRRASGILCHPTSLTSQYGIGDLGKGAFDFIRFLFQARQRYWQILPLTPPLDGELSPYQSQSAFAGNPALISLGKLVTMGLLTVADVQEAMDKEGKLTLIEATANKRRLLKRAFDSKAWQQMAQSDDWNTFCAEEAEWLDDYALYMAIKEAFGGKAWTAWDADIRDRKPSALAKWREKLAREIDYYRFEQYLFERQWQELRMQARRFAVKIIGDLPIFVAHNSADVWANPHLFELDEVGRPTAVAGVPPDYFSEEGQLWGNPLYRWDVMKKDNYAWWTMRMKRTLAQVDIVRLDHFRGFEAYWRVDANEKTAINGKWVKGPCEDLFIALEKACGKLPVIAEDLGTITDEVNELRMKLGLPGMKILHFDLDTQSEVPLRAPKNSVLYTGTHDNNTTVGWLTEDLAPRDRDAVRRALMRTVGDETSDARLAIRFAYASNADTVIVPMQDVLELGTTARMNLPGTIEGNWSWRMPKGSLTQERAAFLRGITNEYDR